VRNRIDSKLSDVKNGDLSNWRRPVVRTMIGLFVIRCAFGMHSLVHLSRASARMTPPQQQGLSAVEGKRMFESTCVNSYCHAEDGRGSGPTNLQNRHFTPTQVTQIISNGVPGTSMPEWKTTYDQEQIAKLTAYVLSLSSESAAELAQVSPAPPQSLPANASTRADGATNSYAQDIEAQIGGNAAQGRSIFFDDTEPANCGICHTFQGEGGSVGPDLTGLASKPPDEILRSILRRDTVVEPKYATLEVATRDGQRYMGVERDETEKVFRLYDTSSMPPVSRSFLKSNIVKVETLKGSVMPGDYGEKYSRKDFLDLITYLKAGGPNPNLMFPHTR
jgi:putative heme-binding domain-containing protein